MSDLLGGNKTAFKKIFRLYYPRLIRYSSSILKDTTEAEDLVQEVFIQLWEYRNQLKPEKNLAAYLYTLTRNKCYNAIKRRIVEEKYLKNQAAMETEELYHISFGSNDEFVAMEDMLNEELNRIMNEMPQRCAEAFRLKWMEGKKIREIAEIMQISTTMVDKHLAKGFQIIRHNLTSKMFMLFLVMVKLS